MSDEIIAYQLVFSDGRTSRVLYSKDEADRFKKASDITVDIRALYAAPPAPSVAVKALEWEIDEPEWHVAKTCFGFGYEVRKTDRGAVRFRYGTRSFEPFEGSFEAAKAFCQADYVARIRSALSAQVQDVAGWQDISTIEPKDGMIVMGWGEYRERDGFSPAFMRWSEWVGGWAVNAMPFYPTHWMPLPAAPAKQEG